MSNVSITAAVAKEKLQQMAEYPYEMRASEIMGVTVYDKQQNKIGSVKDLILGKDGKIKVIVDVSFLGIEGKHIAIDYDDSMARREPVGPPPPPPPPPPPH